MKAHVYQELTLNKFIHLVVAENNFLCRYFCRLGPPLKYLVSCAVGGRLFTRLWPRIIILRVGFCFRVSL